MKRLNGWDAVLLYSESPNVHMHTLKIAVIDAADLNGEFDFDRFRDAFRRRLHRLEPLRYQLVDIPLRLHHPMWLEDCEIDLDYHLRRVRVAEPGGRREFDDLIGRIASTPLDRDHPLWEFHFVEGMADGRFAVVGKVHHSLADGVAAANLMARALDEDETDDDGGYRACVPPTKGDLLRAAGRDHLRQIAKLPALVKATAAGVTRVRRRVRERGRDPALARTFHPPETFLNHVVTPTRTFATATLALADVKHTAKHLKVTINDVVLATTAGAMRELLLRYDGQADAPIIGSVPTSLDPADRISGNALAGLLVSLPVNVDDPLERVRLTHRATGIAKENMRLLGPTLMGRWAAYVPPPIAPAALAWQARRDVQNKLFNLPISNVAGPRERGYIAGAPMSEIYSVGPVMGGSGINITVWSYVEQLNISVIADDQTFSDVHEVTDAMVHAFVEIRRAAGLSTELTEVVTAMAPATAS